MIGKNHNNWHYLLNIVLVILKGLLLSSIWILLGISGWALIQIKKSPFDLILGLPLVLIAIGFVIHSLWSAILSIFSPEFNKSTCIFCHEIDEEGKLRIKKFAKWFLWTSKF